MAHFIIKHGGDLTHITDDPAGSDRYRTRCNRRLRYAHLGVQAGSECANCGTPEEFAAVSDQQHQEWLAKEAALKQANEEAQARREVRVAAQRQSTNHLAQLLSRIPNIQVEVKEDHIGANLTIIFEGHTFETKGRAL